MQVTAHIHHLLPQHTHTHTLTQARLSQANKSKELYFGYTNIYILSLQSVLIPLNASPDICPVHLLRFPLRRQGRTAGSSLGIRERDDPVSPAPTLTEPSLLYPSNEQAQVGVFRFILTLHYGMSRYLTWLKPFPTLLHFSFPRFHLFLGCA